MDLGSAQQTLVVILSTTLAIFLILAIAAAILFIQLLNRLHRLADKAEHVVQSAEDIGETVKSIVTPVSLLGFGRSIFDALANRGKDNKEK